VQDQLYKSHCVRTVFGCVRLLGTCVTLTVVCVGTHALITPGLYLLSSLIFP
jgi:hypothetical protein